MNILGNLFLLYLDLPVWALLVVAFVSFGIAFAAYRISYRIGGKQ